MKKIISIILIIGWITSSISAQEKKALTLEDVMKFKQIKEVKLSDYGSWLAYSVKLDRGNGELVIQSLTNKTIFSIERGVQPEFSSDEKWALGIIEPDFLEAEKNEKDKPKNGLGLLNLANGELAKYKEIKSAGFSKNAKWLALHSFEKKDTSKNAKPKKFVGSDLILKSLADSFCDTIKSVSAFAFDSLSTYMAFTVLDSSRSSNGLYMYDLKARVKKQIDSSKNLVIENLTWNKNNKLAFTKCFLKKDEKKDSAEVFYWDGQLTKTASSTDVSKGWFVPSENKISWSKNGDYLFFGIKPIKIVDVKSEKDTSKKNPYDFTNILSKREVDVWQWNDPLIKSNEKKEWNDKNKFTYTTLYDLQKKKIIYLADLEVPTVITNDNPNVAIARSDKPYQILKTWDGNYNDFYIVSLKDGTRKKIASKLESQVYLSPNGNYAAYYLKKNWFLYDYEKDLTMNLTNKLNVSFADEDNDTPSEPNSYGIGGWTESDKFVLVYDKYDIWKFDTKTGNATCLTNSFGRINKTTLKIVNYDREKTYFANDEKVIITAFSHENKSNTFYSIRLNDNTVKPLVVENKNFKVIAKAKRVNKIIYTRETYNEYPDLWGTNLDYQNPEKLTNYNQQLEKIAWGTSTLIKWNSTDGKDLEGAVILPGNYEEGKKYPVLVYFYEISSHRVHEFNEMVVNHRPNFPYYASNGYIIFLPDVKFEIGRPGNSAIKCIMPGVQKLIDMGIADSKGIALHGHSWGGYQTAFMVTQTELFACAIAGAPVGNMTSAYSGIRWGTGLARQFQYEKSQSRIGGTLWEKPFSFIENSPVFYADKINTPLLLMHGDEDDAVPWYQSIEIYLAMRRLGKECIFLQYRSEPHHPRKYPNKLDYSIKMKEYIDYYCKKTEEPEWIKNGVPYLGK